MWVDCLSGDNSITQIMWDAISDLHASIAMKLKIATHNIHAFPLKHSAHSTWIQTLLLDIWYDLIKD